MNRELDAELCRNYPHVFADRRGSMRTTAMCWGFECGDGWYDLLNEAAAGLEPLCKAEFDKYARLEKRWYKYARQIIGLTARVSFVFHAVYTVVNWICPGLYSSPLHWYGGGPRASQVKEKFGTLRFYMTHQTEEMDKIISVAERKSAITCEECGKKGKLRGSGWASTRCSPCWKKKQDA